VPATVVITGPMIAPEAETLLRGHDIACIAIEPARVDSDLKRLCAEHRPEGLIVRYGTVDASVMDASDRLRVIANHGVGYDNIDVAAATARGLPVLITRGANALSVAEMAVTLILALVKRLPRFDATVKSGGWRPPGVLPIELAGKRVGLVGYGATGRETARLLQPFRVELAAFDPGLAPEPGAPPVRLVSRIEELLSWADIVSLHAPLTEATRNLLDRERLRCMKPGAVLVNCARGQIIDEAALDEALRDGRLAGAALDTFATEPCPSGLPLLTAPNLITTPHVAGVTQEAFARMGMIAAANVASILRGTELVAENLVNPEVLAPGRAGSAR